MIQDAVRETQCTSCLHKDVCKHKKDFLDICDAVFKATVRKPCTDEKKFSTTPVTNYECLSCIEVKCRYYKMQAINPRLFDTTITNPCDIHTSPSPCVIHTSSNPYAINGSSDCTMPNPLNTIKKENN